MTRIEIDADQKTHYEQSLEEALSEAERERDDARTQRNHYDEMRQEAEQRTMREISRWETVEAERDEARAEVERLRTAIDRAALDLGTETAKGPLGVYADLVAALVETEEENVG